MEPAQLGMRLWWATQTRVDRAIAILLLAGFVALMVFAAGLIAQSTVVAASGLIVAVVLSSTRLILHWLQRRRATRSATEAD